MGISSFLTSHNNCSSRVETFDKEIKKCSSKREERELEEKLLKPEKTLPYSGQTPTATGPREFAVTFFLPGRSALMLLQKHFRVSTYVEKSISNPALLIDFLLALENGEISYDAKTRKFNFGPKRTSNGGSTEVDTGEQRARHRSRS